MKITLPGPVVAAIQSLEIAGFQAVAVGGCVRDALMGRTPGDYDVATSARPAQVMDLFKDFKLFATGLKHGTVTLVMGDMPIEITTFRVDGAYRDHRRPDDVTFTNQLMEDVRRRDFTVNALCWGHSGLIDYVGGVADLNARLIRCVGDPDARFSEDALRILRALRFSSQLDFDIHPDTATAVERKRELLRHIAAERIRVELEKLMEGARAERVMAGYRGVFHVFLPELQALTADQWTRACRRVSRASGPAVKLAALLGDAPDFLAALARLRLDNQTLQSVRLLIETKTAAISPSRASLRRIASEHGFDMAAQMIELRMADGQPEAALRAAAEVLSDICTKGDCITLRQLAVNGRDLTALGLPGQEIGKTLHRLLDSVMDDGVENERGALLAAATRWLTE